MSNEIKLRKFKDVVTANPVIKSTEGSNGFVDLMISATEIVNHNLRLSGIQVKFKTQTTLMPMGKAISKSALTFGDSNELHEWGEFNESKKELNGYSKRLGGITNINNDMTSESVVMILAELIRFYVEHNK